MNFPFHRVECPHEQYMVSAISFLGCDWSITLQEGSWSVLPQPLCNHCLLQLVGLLAKFCLFCIEEVSIANNKKEQLLYLLIALLTLIKHHKCYQTFADTSYFSLSPLIQVLDYLSEVVDSNNDGSSA